MKTNRTLLALQIGLFLGFGFAGNTCASLALLSSSMTDTNPPTAPAQIEIVSSNPGRVEVSWTAATDDAGSVTYNLQRDRITLAESLTTTNYVDTTALGGREYAYRVQAVDASGNVSPFSPVATASVPAPEPVPTPGLLFEAWNNLTNIDLEVLVKRIQAGEPDFSGLASAADSRTVYDDDSHQNYGGRLTGWLVPQESGRYELFLRSQEKAELWLSANDQPGEMVPIAVRPECCHNFEESGDIRTSAPITFSAGEKYALQVLWTAGAGSGYAQVAWRKVGDAIPSGGLIPIPGQFLSALWDPTVGPPQVTGKTLEFSGIGSNAVLHVEAIGERPIQYRWRLLDTNLVAAATNDTLTVTNVALQSIGSLYSVEMENPSGASAATFALFPRGTLFIEAEDFDFGGGASITNQAIGLTGSYLGGSFFGRGDDLDLGFDYKANSTNSSSYRTNTMVATYPLPSAAARARGPFDLGKNEAVTGNDPGEWYNYTRTYPEPAADYYVVGRFLSNAAPARVQLDLMVGSTNGATKLGEFAIAAANRQTNGVMAVLTGTNSLPVVFKGWSGTHTLRLTILPGSSPDIDFLALVPLTPPPSTNQVNALSISKVAGNNVVLTWTEGILESADAILGPWTTVLKASSPFTVPLSGPRKFYRLR